MEGQSRLPGKKPKLSPKNFIRVGQKERGHKEIRAKKSAQAKPTSKTGHGLVELQGVRRKMKRNAFGYVNGSDMSHKEVSLYHKANENHYYVLGKTRIGFIHSTNIY